MRVIDTHLHMWNDDVLSYVRDDAPYRGHFAELELTYKDPEAGALYAAADLAVRRSPTFARVESIFVQSHTIESDYLAEVRWVESFAANVGIVGVVAGAQLHRGLDTITHLDELGTCPLVVGVRHDLADQGPEISTAFVLGAREVALRGWALDVRMQPAQLPDIARLAGAIPELRMMLDHLGSPAVGTADAPLTPAAEWIRDIEELATHPGVYCKLSGLPAAADGSWDEEQMLLFLDAAADAFGVERLVWGSDWPLSAWGPAEDGDPWAPEDGSATYQVRARQRWLDAVVDWADSRGHDVDAILWTNARRFYRLDEVRSAPEEPRRRGFFARLFGG